MKTCDPFATSVGSRWTVPVPVLRLTSGVYVGVVAAKDLAIVNTPGSKRRATTIAITPALFSILTLAILFRKALGKYYFQLLTRFSVWTVFNPANDCKKWNLVSDHAQVHRIPTYRGPFFLHQKIWTLSDSCK